jgi:hypothetical protein
MDYDTIIFIITTVASLVYGLIQKQKNGKCLLAIDNLADLGAHAYEALQCPGITQGEVEGTIKRLETLWTDAKTKDGDVQTVMESKEPKV